ncbi:MAG: hypothetical protein NTX86_01665 [Candidatus Dependentiae bacterium]|nr:hypothetical protein [Candidatus Dependentiae bacterium]
MTKKNIFLLLVASCFLIGSLQSTDARTKRNLINTLEHDCTLLKKQKSFFEQRIPAHTKIANTLDKKSSATTDTKLKNKLTQHKKYKADLANHYQAMADKTDKLIEKLKAQQIKLQSNVS